MHHSRRWAPVLLGTLAGVALCAAVPALAQDEFVDDDFDIQDADDPGTFAILDASGDTYGVEITADCLNGPYSATIRPSTDHQDLVSIDRTRASVAQRQPGNPAPISISGVCPGGLDFEDVLLTCETARIDASVSGRNGNWTGRFSADGRRCVGLVGGICTEGLVGESCNLDPDCDDTPDDGVCSVPRSATVEELECVEQACEDSETVSRFGSVGGRCTEGQLGRSCSEDSDCGAPTIDGACTPELKKLKIKGRGDAVIVIPF